jgi:hypothetical protein
MAEIPIMLARSKVNRLRDLQPVLQIGDHQTEEPDSRTSARSLWQRLFAGVEATPSIRAWPDC